MKMTRIQQIEAQRIRREYPEIAEKDIEFMVMTRKQRDRYFAWQYTKAILVAALAYLALVWFLSL